MLVTRTSVLVSPPTILSLSSYLTAQEIADKTYPNRVHQRPTHQGSRDADERPLEEEPGKGL